MPLSKVATAEFAGLAEMAINLSHPEYPEDYDGISARDP